jgi:hypothetical protein
MRSVAKTSVLRASRAGRLLPLLILALTALSVCADGAAASPSRFAYEVCDSTLPGGGSPETSFTSQSSMAAFNSCASPGGSLGIVETGSDQATFAYLSVAVPETPEGFVELVTLTAQNCGGAANHFSHVWENNWPPNCVGDSKRTFPIATQPSFLGGPGGGFNIVMSCDGNVGSCGPGATVSAHYVVATEVDVKAPTVKGVAGSLLSSGVLRGHQELSAEAADVGGGLGKLEVIVNGLSAGAPAVGNCNVVQANNSSFQGTVAATPTPCPTKQKGSWVLDTAAYPFQNGSNSVQVCASDYSNLPNTTANKTCSSVQTVSVDNSCAESPVAGGEVLTAQFARSHKEAVTVPYDTTAKVTGELANNAGDAISGATICVQIKTQGSRRGLRPAGTATTDANGHFVYKVPPGPNRQVLLGYRHDSFQVARAVRYYAHIRPTIELSRGRVENGSTIRIHGKLPGGRRAGGRVVVLQASALRSKEWFTFLRATTNKAGVYHCRYQFDATTRTTSYRIRAVVPKQRGFPWEVGHSEPAVVTVRGSG